MKRRHFLQFSSSLFASLGISQFDLMHQANRYAQVLAQSTPRKLALLVGINGYEPAIGQLNGCITDVDMQRELLVHRFGFKHNDVLEVTDDKATRQGILTAFNEHLIKQAKPGDVVVFHYSGHGSRVLDPDPIENDKYNSTMVPFDRPGASATSSDKPVLDITGRTLFLLMSAVQTEKLTVVLDSCYSGGGKRGNVVVRAARLGKGLSLTASPEESDYQNQLLSQLNLSKAEFHKLRQKGVAKGVVIASAQSDQEATDATFDGFNAGAFTYLMTRYLWQETGNDAFEKVFVNLALHTIDLGGKQEPNFSVEPGSNNGSKPLYFLEKTRPAAEAVIRKVTGDQVEFWLGGIASQSLEAFKAGAIFTIIDDKGQERGKIEQQSRVGLVGYGKVIQTSQPEIVKEGTLLQEQVRGMPTDLTLRIGVDDSLGAEKAQAQAKLQGQKRIEPVAVQQKSVVHYLLGRVTQEEFQSWQGVSNPPPVGSLGLFTPDKVPVPGSFGQVGESAENAVLRLRSKLKVLLAGRILKSLGNGDSSKLNVTTSLTALGGKGTSITMSTRGAQNAQATLPPGVSNRFKVGTNVQIDMQNNEKRPLYVSVLVIDSSGDMIVLFPVDWSAPEDAALVKPDQKISVKDITLEGPSGTLEVLVLASAQPLRNALKGLQRIATARRIGQGPVPVEGEPVAVIDNLLGDLNDSRATVGRQKGNSAVATDQLATMSTIIEVVE